MTEMHNVQVHCNVHFIMTTGYNIIQVHCFQTMHTTVKCVHATPALTMNSFPLLSRTSTSSSTNPAYIRGSTTSGGAMEYTASDEQVRTINSAMVAQ